MLILERNREESVMINDNIRVTVLSIGMNKVTLGFEAPKDIPIHRQEVWEKIKAEES